MPRTVVFLLGALFAALSPLATAQVDEVALEALDQLKEGVDDHKPELVNEALRDLDDVYVKLDPKTLKKVHKGISTMFAKLVPREGNSLIRGGFVDEAELQGTRRQVEDCYVLAVGMLFDKEDGADLLTTALKKKHVKDWPEVRAVIYEGLSYRVDATLVKEFTKILTDPSPRVAAAGAAALGRYFEEDMETRRGIVKSLIEVYQKHHTAMEKEAKKGREEVAADYLASVEVAFGESLTALTRRSLTEAPEWTEWWGEHGDDEEW